MATILEFEPRPARHGTGGERRATAQIVIFPGIRYERIESDAAAPKRRPVRRRPASAKTLRQG